MSVMASPRYGLPQTPRSRFSKALPPPPDAAEGEGLKPWIAPFNGLPASPRAPVPNPMMPPKTIPRRPVGAAKTDVKTDTTTPRSSAGQISQTSRLESQTSPTTMITTDESRDNVPPIPPKDPERRRRRDSDASSSRSPASPTSSIRSSPPRTELWRRRSMKGEQSLLLPELKLNGSNGSTASSQVIQPRPQPQPSKPTNRALPSLPSEPAGRNINPLSFVPARRPPPQPDMGSKTSKHVQQQTSTSAFPPRSTSLQTMDAGSGDSSTGQDSRDVGLNSGSARPTDSKSRPNNITGPSSIKSPVTQPEILRKSLPVPSEADHISHPQPSPTTQILAAYTRYPTPDYSKSDEEQPLASEIKSPASPVSIETPQNSISPPPRTQLLSVGPSRIEEEEGHSATADYLAAMSRPVSELVMTPEEKSAPLFSETTRIQSPPIKSARPPTAAEELTLSPKSNSSIPHSLQIMSPSSTTSNLLSPPVASKAPSSAPLTTVSGPTPVPPATLSPAFEVFTRLAAAPAGPGTVFEAAPLSAMHFECYQRHRTLRESRNHMYPVACMVCEKKDMERRMMCTWCCLRCCNTCTQALTTTPGRDLKESMLKLARTQA